jgi:hypothetical protein
MVLCLMRYKLHRYLYPVVYRMSAHYSSQSLQYSGRFMSGRIMHDFLRILSKFCKSESLDSYSNLLPPWAGSGGWKSDVPKRLVAAPDPFRRVAAANNPKPG